MVLASTIYAMNHPLQPHSAFTLMPSVADGVSKWSIRTSRGVQDGWGRTCEKPGAPVFLVLHGGPGLFAANRARFEQAFSRWHGG
jgi:hypothetical protein